jgi:hypothetical protein
MTRKLLHLFCAGLIAGTMFLSSCADEEEPTPTGDDRDKFVGSWTCNETSQQNGASTFTIHINKNNSNTTGINIESFYNMGFQNVASATVTGSSFSVPSQPYAGLTISGSGTSTGATSLNMSYIVINGSVHDTCTASCTKQ